MARAIADFKFEQPPGTSFKKSVDENFSKYILRTDVPFRLKIKHDTPNGSEHSVRVAVEFEFNCPVESTLFDFAIAEAKSFISLPFKITKVDFAWKTSGHNHNGSKEFSIEDVLAHEGKNFHFFNIGGENHKINMRSQRYKLFKKQLNCVCCGIEGKIFLLDRSNNKGSYHFNLYAKESGQLILMTKDHAIPYSAGGPNHSSNFQTMCTICNNIKGNASISLSQLKEMRKTFDEIFNSKGKFVAMQKMKEIRNKFIVPTVRVVKKRRVSAVDFKSYTEKSKSEFLVCKCDINIVINPIGLYGLSCYVKTNLIPIETVPVGTKIACLGEAKDNNLKFKTEGGTEFVARHSHFEIPEEAFTKSEGVV